ncbi:enoyl-CoA hydratase/isomerase family protein [Altererythrobacter confluentis]|uniref:Enoyl-CoA hydratase/isomerase family protein n=1 Tax=Allopontixanthobacter confluentis TaxID=1849021 RepID=A0A6L7GDK0_9SPHN|nr:enoyl-CoA hydratase/isomerase family protein [Allopontixanthobacter confluentis]MXP13670.1 enoyl-CoA hydratase/isomerase family protein [Allopontixanthobacter confluentis]
MTLRLEKDGTIARLLIDRPDKRNAFDLAMWESMPRLLADVVSDRGIRLLEVRSATGGTFSAGADIKEMVANSDDRHWREINQAEINRAQHALARVAVPTVAFIEGDCIGMGCGLALACDIRVATEKARFGITPAKLGLVYPLHDTKLLMDLVGPGMAKTMLFTGAMIDAARALDCGLVELIADSPAQISDAILEASPHSIHETKRFIRAILDGQTEDDSYSLGVFAAAFSLPDFREGAAAFVEKRKPQFGK